MPSASLPFSVLPFKGNVYDCTVQNMYGVMSVNCSQETVNNIVYYNIVFIIKIGMYYAIFNCSKHYTLYCFGTTFMITEVGK